MIVISLIPERTLPGIEPHHPRKIVRGQMINQYRMPVRGHIRASIFAKCFQRSGDGIELFRGLGSLFCESTAPGTESIFAPMVDFRVKSRLRANSRNPSRVDSSACTRATAKADGCVPMPNPETSLMRHCIGRKTIQQTDWQGDNGRA